MIFWYPGLTASCPRCMLESRYKKVLSKPELGTGSSAGAAVCVTEYLNAIKDIAAKCIGNIAAKNHYLYVTEIDKEILQEFLDATADEVQHFGVRALRDEAQYYFSHALREYSHTHEEYAHIHISGTLDDIVITPSEDE